MLALFQLVLDWRRLLVHSASLPPTRSARGEIGQDAEIQGIFNVEGRSHTLWEELCLDVCWDKVWFVDLCSAGFQHLESSVSKSYKHDWTWVFHSFMCQLSPCKGFPLVSFFVNKAPCSKFEKKRLVYVVVWGQTSPHRCRRGTVSEWCPHSGIS